MTNPKKGLAVFDFDGTIIKKDSFIEFIRFTNGPTKLYACYLYYSIYIILYFIKLYPNYKLKELLFGFFYKGTEEDKLKTLGDEFSIKKIDSFYCKHTESILNWHKEQNHDIVILTASSSLWIGNWCERNGYIIIDTKFEVKNDKFTGKIEGKNCYGKEKERRIEEILHNYEFKQTYGYGDNKSDLFFLRKLNHVHYGSLDKKPMEHK